MVARSIFSHVMREGLGRSLGRGDTLPACDQPVMETPVEFREESVILAIFNEAQSIR